ncbi:putative tyrosine-protein kinase Wsck [Coccinella septempunctata]|uniref:putative tyrosine-protein kinase Wsck n=1 Tax=Coccinella septempunctata TaxID=41139 RepID=UPI001D08E6D1|nr:putative tyrosine-protein kinase Wsck [Coccinella septempunctata]
MSILLFILLIFFEYSHGIEKGTYIGCYKYDGSQNVISTVPNVQDCVEKCYKKSFKYAVLSNNINSCFCSNFLGDSGNSNGQEKCNEYSVYSSEDLIPGPPKNFMVKSVTEVGVEISWEKPEGYVEITKYEITAGVLHTFSQYPIQNATWVYSNTTFQTTLSLQSASSFNITIQGRSENGLGLPASKVVETLIGEPDNKPYPPKILSRSGSQMLIKIYPVINNNGPINYYQVIVLDETAKEIFQPEYLKNYYESLEKGLNYYIAAELTPEGINKNFTIGDNQHYGPYHNVELLSSLRYNIIVGIVSTYNNITKVSYSDPSKIDQSSFEHNNTENNSSGASTLLIVAIVILSFILIVIILGFMILRNRVLSRHRHNRLSEQELTLQGPMISIENSAYLPEDEQILVNHYKNLRRNVKIFNLKDELSVDAHSIIGKGRFGTICNASLNENNHSTSLVAYTIADKTLAPEEKKQMLKSLDMLIKCNKHINLIELVGTSESSHMLYVLLKVFPMNLKQFLINSRTMLQNKFSKVSESQVLDIIIQISQGLLELEKCKIIHTKLCARNIMLSDDLVPKIFGFGLADYVIDQELDCTRWTAVEVLKGQDFTSRSPIWSFGVLLWEICSVGGTPFSHISNIAELTDKVSRGTRLPQLKYFSDEVYQIMLNCWQIDMGERPSCESLCISTEGLNENLIIPFISFQLYQTFEYEQYKPELEFKPFPV